MIDKLIGLVFTPWTLLAIPVAFYLLPYLTWYKHLMSIPGPFFAAFTHLWLTLQARKTTRYLAVDEAHKKYGKFVRIAPNQVSINDDAAITTVYGHGSGTLKPDFYDAFVSVHRGLFNVRDRADHARKRKIVSHTFSAKSVRQFEQYIHHNMEEFVRQWDKMSTEAGPGYAKFDALHWFNYLAFDVIGDLAFGKPFGMLKKGKDEAEFRLTPDSPVEYCSAIDVMNNRGELVAAVATYPMMKPYTWLFPDPFFRQGAKAVGQLAGIAHAAVSTRLEQGSNGRVDLLARLMEGKDASGKPLGREELTGEALTNLVAGSDTTSNSTCALLYYVLKNPRVLQKLREEIDEAIPDINEIPSYETVKDLAYCKATIEETMRLHSTAALGLPRLVPEGPGITIDGVTFPPGTVLSVPSYTIHHSKEIWGEDAKEFKPERFLKGTVTDRQRIAFLPFSYGPRSCVGRNVAEMEMMLTVATVFRKYDFELYQDELGTREGFLRKPDGLMVGMRRRDAA